MNRNNTVAQSTSVTFDMTTDVVVVGAGAGGFSAALNAVENGAEVIMLERADFVGGTTNKSAGWYWMPNNRHLREAGFTDPKEDALRYMARLAAPTHYNPVAAPFGLPPERYALVEAFYDNAADAAEALERAGAVDAYHAAEIPDYNAHLPENKAPFGRVLQPRDADGNVGFGDVLVAGLNRAAVDKGIDIRLSHRVLQVVVNDAGAVVGVIAHQADGTATAIGARRGVIFTTGGFAHNKTLTREFLFGPVYGSCAVDASTGDFVQIGADLGSPLGNMNYPWMAPMPLERALWANHDDPTIMCMFAPPGDSMIMVNRYGKRVVNEKVQYNEQMQVFQVWDPMRLEYPNLVLFMIWDEATRELFAGELLGNPIAPEGADAAHIVRADTLEGLQDAITEKLQQLSEYLGGFTLDDDFSTQLAGTVARYNGYARDGHDPEFHRGEQPIQHYFNQFNGPPRPGNDRNPLMYPFRDSGPYYATLLAPATLDTKGGPTINRNAQVVDQSGTPIPGLYGAGNCVASPSGKAYWAGGATIGCAFTFGYLAGKHAAAQPERQI